MAGWLALSKAGGQSELGLDRWPLICYWDTEPTPPSVNGLPLPTSHGCEKQPRALGVALLNK